MRRCEREGVEWPRTIRDAADAGMTTLHWHEGIADIAPPAQWWDVSDPLRARERHIMAAECDEHIRCTRTPNLKAHLRETVALPGMSVEEHCRWAARVVAKWPGWKRACLGRLP